MLSLIFGFDFWEFEDCNKEVRLLMLAGAAVRFFCGPQTLQDQRNKIAITAFSVVFTT